MDNESQKKKTDANGRNKPVGLILFSSLAILLLFIGELYVMVAMDGALLEIALVGVAILVFAYLDLSSIIKWIRVNEEEREEQYAGMLKAEKASYLLIRKYFDEIEEQLALMEDKVSDPFQEIVAAQKATAKVTINRNKENTDALMNSNDRLLDIVFGMESKIEEMSATISRAMPDQSGDANAEVVQKQLEMSNQIRDLELNLKNEILQAVSTLSSVQPQVVMAPPQMMPMQQAPAVPEPLGDLELGGLGELENFATLEADVLAEPDGTEPDLMAGMSGESELGSLGESELSLGSLGESESALGSLSEPESTLGSLSEPEPVLGSLGEPESALGSLGEPESVLGSLGEPESVLGSLGEPEPALGSLGEPEPVLGSLGEPEPALGSLGEPESVLSSLEEPEPALGSLTESESALDSLLEPESALGSLGEPESIPGSLAEPEPALETLAEPVSALEALSKTKPLAEPEALSELAMPELPPMPDLSDPNRDLSSDELDGLLASIAAEEASLEPEPEPEPGLPPMPDLSDPNRAMSPDEIAALFANLG